MKVLEQTNSRSGRAFSIGRSWSLAGVLSLAFAGASIAQAQTVQYTSLPLPVPSVIQSSTLKSHMDPAQVIHLAISIPPAAPVGLQNFVDDVSNPRSANYRKFLTPKEVGQKFGVTDAQVQQVVAYFKGQGFNITLISDNHLSILADCTVKQAEAAFRTTFNKYHATNSSAPGRTDYYSYSKPLQVPSTISSLVLGVMGAENFTKPVHRALTPAQTQVLYNLQPLRTGGFNGEGRNIAISNWDGYRLTNVPLYYAQFSLPTPSGGVGSNIKVVTMNGGSGSGTPTAEGDIDIQMVLGMAPLCNFTIYDDGSFNLVSVLSREAQDNTADIISESYGWNLGTSDALSAHNVHLSMAAQGITYMAASGDSGTTLEPYAYSNYDPEVLMVGGTVATIGTGGARTSEVAWDGGGGGWSTNSATFNVRPSWQVGKGVSTTINYRLTPDIALNASGTDGAYQFFLNGTLNSGYVGTSFACPVFAGMLGVAEQKLISLGLLSANSAGKRRMGRIQNQIYAQNGRSDVWYDVTSGSNGTLPNGVTSTAGVGWDFTTGWGAIDINAFVAALAASPPVVLTPVSASIYGGQGTNPVGSYVQLASIDGNYYSAGSVMTASGAAVADDLGFTTTSDPSKVTSITFSAVGYSTKSVTSFLYLYNNTTGAFDLLSSQVIGTSSTSNTFTLSSGVSKYISSAKKVRAIVRTLVPIRLGATSYTFNLDQVTVTLGF